MDKQTVFDMFQKTTGTFRATEFSAPTGVKLYVAYEDSLIDFAHAIEQSVIERLNARETIAYIKQNPYGTPTLVWNDMNKVDYACRVVKHPDIPLFVSATLEE